MYVDNQMNMRSYKVALFFTVAIFLAHCNYKPKNTNNPQTPKTDTIGQKLTQRAQTFYELFKELEGVWILKDYADALVDGQSPYEVQKEILNRTLYFDINYLQSSHIGVSDHYYHQTEASGIDYLKLVDDTLVFDYQTWDEEITEYIVAPIQKVYWKDIKRSILCAEIDDKYYEFIHTRSNCIDSYFDCATVSFVNRTVMSGTYEIFDVNGNLLAENVVLDENGVTTGFDDVSRMILHYFYRECYGQFEYDIIQFKHDSTDMEIKNCKFENIFKVRFMNDTLLLNSLDVIKENSELIITDRGPTLIMIRKNRLMAKF